MSATTLLSIGEGMPVQNGYAPGNFSVVNRTVGHVIGIDVLSEAGSETILLVNDGDSADLPLVGIASLLIYSVDGTYPVLILYMNSTLDITLSAAPIIGNTAANPVPVVVV